MLINGLSLRDEFDINNSARIKKCNQHHFDLRPWLTRFLRSRRAGAEPLLALSLRLRVIFKHPSFVSRNDLGEQFEVILHVFEHVLADLHPSLFLVVRKQFEHHFRANFLQSELLGDYLPNSLPINSYLLSDHPDRQTSAPPHCLSHRFYVFISF